MAQQDLDRNQPATPYKLQRARERGQVAKSVDVVTVIVFTTATVYLTWQGLPTAFRHFRFDQMLFVQAGRVATSASMWPLADRSIHALLAIVGPFFGAVMIAAVIGNVMQTGPVLSAEPLKIDFNRLNPVNGFKRIVSMRTLFDVARSVVKLGLLGFVAYLGLSALTGQFYALSSLSALGYLRTLIDDLSSLGLKMALILGLIALADFIYTRRAYAKQMRMSHRELKDEVKQREGDPRIRSRLRQLRREMLKRSQFLRQTRHADVLIINPTHFAVALKYEHGRMVSPQLLAKGAGSLAAAMRDIAARHQITVVRNPPLARRLYKELSVNQSVPPELYAEVARIIVWVFAMRARRQGATAQPVSAGGIA
jgi:flagellar biosynthetic protein FlhB